MHRHVSHAAVHMSQHKTSSVHHEALSVPESSHGSGDQGSGSKVSGEGSKRWQDPYHLLAAEPAA